VTGSGNAVRFDPKRSLLSADPRTGVVPPRTEDDDTVDFGEYAFVEYYRPVVELKQLEQKASAANVTLDTDSRFYSRMRAARRLDGKYIRNERIRDEFYRLADDPGETVDRIDDDDEVKDAVETTLSAFEERVGGEWKAVDDDDDVLRDMSDDAKDRLQDLGYIE
jgi:hypothetical protein